MKIVIAGAGDIGFHLAKLLSIENQDIVLIDNNAEVLHHAQSRLDVLTIEGSSSSWSILQAAEVSKANLFLALTTSEENNLISAIIAKKIGAKQTVARVNNTEYLSEEQRKSFKELGVDQLISPVQLAAQEIYRLVQHCEVTDNFAFENGKIEFNGITLDDDSQMVNCTIEQIDEKFPGIKFNPIAILRGHSTIIPRSKTVLKSNDHLYFLTERNNRDMMRSIIGKELIEVKNIMIIGGTEIGFQTAHLLQNKYQVTIVEKDENICKKLIEKLDNTMVINGDPSNIDLLREEGLGFIDVFIAATPNSETNIVTSLMAEHHSIFKTIALVDNIDYTHISQNIGVDTIINKKLIAANNIFRYVRKGKVEAITSPHGVEAEIIEFLVHKNNQLTKKPLRELRFPDHAIIGSVLRGEEVIIPDGSMTLQLNDKVIIFAMHDAIHKVEQLFK